MRLSLALPSSSSMPCIMLLMPGIMPAILLRGPILRMFCSWSRRSRTVKTPSVMCLMVSFWSSRRLCTCSTSPATSPMPSSLLTNGCGAKRSRSSMCSPVPMKTMGVRVAATAEMAPPPLAWPSVLVMMMAPKSAASLKALAWASACWPMEASSTMMVSSGRMAAWMSTISWNRALSWRWRPEVSTMMTSKRSRRNLSTPSRATTAGSVSVRLP
ncbi:hypothetical protein VTK73DRAFT_7781 [Phialemonium thermophilum]|uniref:Secreted protein n=1 Tax=Phialemonium thermophilum TaxID=223376 RepID=A0ABR3WCP7_9PEZI